MTLPLQAGMTYVSAFVKCLLQLDEQSFLVVMTWFESTSSVRTIPPFKIVRSGQLNCLLAHRK